MLIEMQDGVRAYMKKHAAPCLVIDMDKNITNPGCGCGRTKTFYTPSARLGFEEKKLAKTHNSVAVDGVTIFISRLIEDKEDMQIEIFIEKLFLMKKLAVKGIDTIVAD